MYASFTENYLKELARYAAEVSIPGLDLATQPIPLTDIYVEPQFKSDEMVQSSAFEQEAEQIGLSQRFDRERLKAPRPARSAIENHERL